MMTGRRGCVTCSELGAMAFDDWKNAAPVQMWGYSAFPWSIAQTAMIGLGSGPRCNPSAASRA